MSSVVCWFRRDLRIEDNRALHHALASGAQVIPLFIFDDEILDELPRTDPRVGFIHEQLEKLHGWFRSRGSSLMIRKGKTELVWKEVLDLHRITGVYLNKDYEPYALERDRKIAVMLKDRGIPLFSFKDQVIFEEGDVCKQDGTPYTVFTPYSKKWLEQYAGKKTVQEEKSLRMAFLPMDLRFPSLQEIGFAPSSIKVPPYDLSNLDNYDSLRDHPAADATSHLSPHLRFGTVSIRTIVAGLKPGDTTFLSELIWREFFMQILFHFPGVVNQNFRSKYDGIAWRNDEEEFRRWCRGETGFPLVDAGMRQLNETGFMHNRVRMATASFLCKHLLIDWRWGEAYFAEKLLDYELSSNNGNWQWAAGTGCDAAPYFRIFNPEQQLKRFDKELVYVRKWIPELHGPGYPAPMVDHRMARERALEAYRKGMMV